MLIGHPRGSEKFSATGSYLKEDNLDLLPSAFLTATLQMKYLRFMKTIFSLLFASTLGLAFGQFIPQPMGYNPDENGDAFISVTDLQGMLALYGNAFDNGDSTDIFVVDFVGQEDSTFVIPETTDICYFEWLPEFQDVPEEENYYCINESNLFPLRGVLPAGNTLKFMTIIVKAGWKTTDYEFISWNTHPGVYCYATELKLEGLSWRRRGSNLMDDSVIEVSWNWDGKVVSFIVVRHLDGTWHRLDKVTPGN